MSHAAFLQAITSEPADDTARLVYADFLEETGEPVHVARAEFIRSQIEAQSLHPNHPRRAELEARAEELFADHWAEWWLPVCEAIGLPLSVTGAPSFRERVARFFGRVPAHEGHPYRLEHGTTLGVVQSSPAQTTLRTVTFERGFPQSVSLLGQLREVREAIHRWITAAPLTSLQLHGTVGGEWRHIDGEHLRGVSELTLSNASAMAVTAIAESRHLPHLEDLTLRPDRSNIAWPAEQYRAYVDSSLPDRVRRLKVVIAREDEVWALYGPHLANLVGLSLFGPVDADYGAELTSLLALNLARAEPLTGLTELSMSGIASHSAASLAGWLANQLRRLALYGLSAPGPFCGLVLRNQFSALTDLTVSTRDDIGPVFAAIADSPLACRLRHLRLSGRHTPQWNVKVEFLRLANALDPEKLETLSLDRAVRDVPEVWGELQERFPGRVSVV